MVVGADEMNYAAYTATAKPDNGSVEAFETITLYKYRRPLAKIVVLFLLLVFV